MRKKSQQDINKLNDLVKKYLAGNASAFDELLDELTNHSYSYLIKKVPNIDKKAVELLVKQRLIVEFSNGNTDAAYLYRYVHLRVHETFVQWGVVKGKRESYHIAKVSIENPADNMTDEVDFRLKVMEQTRVTDTQWNYYKLLQDLENKKDNSKFIEGIFDLTYKKLIKYAHKQTICPSLTKEEKEEAVKDVIIKKAYKYLAENKLPKAYYLWMVALKHSLQTRLEFLEKQKQDKVQTLEENCNEVVGLEDIDENTYYQEDPLTEYVAKESMNELIKKLQTILTSQQFKVITFRFVDNMSYVEISKLMNISYNRVREIEKSALGKARKTLAPKNIEI